MNFFEKIKMAIRKIKPKIIVFTVLTIIIIMWLVCPFVVAKNTAELKALVKFSQSPFDEQFWAEFFVSFGEYLTHPWRAVPLCFNEIHIVTFLNCLKVVFYIYISAILIGLIKALPKHEYENIENGSSDWSEDGEQYKVLNRKKGIVLAEKNYLPTDKRGNVNVLVVRRFWCW